MELAQQIVRTAREQIGTPYQHQARLKGVAVDCIGLIYVVCQELNLLPKGFEMPAYGEDPYGQQILKNFAKYYQAIAFPEPGAVLVFTIRKEPQHCAIFGNNSLIHAYDGVDAVKEHDYSDWWKERQVGCFRLF